ncbi:AAA family ATPase [Rhodoferax ferrireducens]|uniref:AAA family ATPase n=1 Tax=Rhodoferax ferrireducens TaxID=192843 RepID=UPI000E0D5C5C|nr:AAA family ATPase [Rhodoferax ferrireducens]
MSKASTITRFRSLESLARKFRKDLKGIQKRKKTPQRKGTTAVAGNDFVLVFAHNGVGKTRLSMEFKGLGKNEEKRDTLYFNAFTEDLFDWDNDFDEDKDRRIKFKAESQFFDGLDGMGIEGQIRPLLHQYTDFDFRINYAAAEIRFYRDVTIAGNRRRLEDIKISRGEENIFVWCFFLAILQLAIEAEKGQPYDWVKYVYIDDPISSLDEQNTIAVAAGLGGLLKREDNKLKVVISTHHGLFFNVMFNELTGKRTSENKENIKKKAYILHRLNEAQTYSLEDTGESPFLHHVAALEELRTVAKSGKISQYHFNSLRSILEKTAIFFGRQHISSCFEGLPKKALYARFLNVRSHAKYSVFESESITASDKEMFREILTAFLTRYSFRLAAAGAIPAQKTIPSSTPVT